MMRLLVVEWKDFKEKIEEVRVDVFVREQGFSEESELDTRDLVSTHILVFDGDESIGTARLLPDGHIGRLAVKSKHRNRGVGKIIMRKIMEVAKNKGLREVRLSAQVRVKDFYKNLGFTEYGKIYKEEGVDHIMMRKEI
jgi:predicted GNAT family N-acyltransferase